MRLWTLFIIGWLMSTVALAVSVSEGRLDLSQEKLGPKSKVELNGLWRFYPGAFLEAQDFSKEWPSDRPFTMVPVPGALGAMPGPDGQPMPQHVWGTYVLELRNVPVWASELGLKLRGDTAYKVLFVEAGAPQKTQLVAQAGLPGPRPQESIPQIIEKLGRFKAPEGEGPYYVVIHLSGFFYVRPNLWITPTLGPMALMERERDWIKLSESIVIGMLLIMTLYNLSLYLHRREDLSSLWLASFCVLILARQVTTSGFFTAFLFPRSHIDLYEAIRKIEFTAMPLSASALLVFVAHTFGFHRWQKHLKWNHLAMVILTIFIAVTDATIYPRILPMMILHSLAVSVAVLILVITAMRRKKEGSFLALLGMISVVVCGWHDVLIGLGTIRTPVFLMPYGMVALIFSQSQVIAKLFSTAFRTADRLSRNLAEEVDRQTLDIRSMLDHIPQGVMNLIAPGVIDKGYSRHLQTVLSRENIAGETLDAVLLSRSNLSTDDRERIQAALSSCLGEEALAFELNSGQLPTELRIQLKDAGFKILQMTWNPVVDKAGIITKFLITCHDVTEMRRYEAEAQEQKRELSYIQELVDVSAEKFSIFYETSVRMLDENLRLVNLNKNRNFEILKILFVNMHTIKGAARTLGFTTLTGWLHEVEQSYALLLKDPEMVWEQSRLAQEVIRTQDMIEYYRRVNETKLGRTTQKSSMISVDREFLVQHTQMLKSLESDSVGSGFNDALAEALIKFEELAFEDSHVVLRDISAPAEKIARDLGKAQPQVIITGIHCGMSYQAQQLLRKVLIHIIRNALDHGIEPAAERLKQGKKAEGTLTMVLSEIRNRLQICITDDGRGLSLYKLERRALELGILSASHVAPPEQLAELIFYPGLSTADTLTEVSGRGIGMDAVKSFIEEAGGSIRVVLEGTPARADYCAFSLVISLPSTLYLRKAATPATPVSSAS
ncbi:MAG TPA: 7TM diverse intracellular signaling domain-containing protein [Oligoflexus sp.]|uniref:7TM diverse intracellular signaling domain-containing protein n=1 Tax=Oligoflexus sp. TaxID=1971216 RepID=UPI002D7E9BE9|nr:7TM diverse intracellular signaling domain-containing protein [Oligoflexus sp.]HET9238014.1 7TM diverse intracellular signaling domain-containing protein [Oligoflexus sp.]